MKTEPFDSEREQLKQGKTSRPRGWKTVWLLGDAALSKSPRLEGLVAGEFRPVHTWGEVSERSPILSRCAR